MVGKSGIAVVVAIDKEQSEARIVQNVRQRVLEQPVYNGDAFQPRA